MAIQDKTLTCKECGESFIFTAGEQEFFQQKGFVNEPGRCTTCRRSRRSNGSSSGSYNRSEERQMFSVVCARCGKDAQVPFQPRGDRPVYCSDCFRQEASTTTRRY